jgi:hypothetical protein
MTNSLATAAIQFSLASVANQAAVARVTEKLPELTAKTQAFDRSNSQTTLNMMSLTMMNGQSPMRMLRQVLAEIEKRKMALAEAQLNHAKLLVEIEELNAKDPTPIGEAELRLKYVSQSMMESKVNGAFKDIAALIDAYDNIKAKHKIDDWDETTFEAEEKKHHIRRGFEFLYRNLIQFSRPQEVTIEYLQQYGVHVQVALGEVSGYITLVEQRIVKGERPTGADMEIFFDDMADKYAPCADEASDRMFGKLDFTNTDYMLKLGKEK